MLSKQKDTKDWCHPEAYFAASSGLIERDIVSMLMRASYVLHELSIFVNVSREAGLLSSSCHSWKGLIFPKLFKDTGQKCPEA